MRYDDVKIGMTVHLDGKYNGTGKVIAMSSPDEDDCCFIEGSDPGPYNEPDDDHVMRVKCADGKVRWYSEADINDDVVTLGADPTNFSVQQSGTTIIEVAGVKITIVK